MPVIDRWRHWRPGERNSADTPTNLPTKPPEANLTDTDTPFVSFVSSLSGVVAEICDYSRWADDFDCWMLNQCRFCDHYWTPLADLHTDFCGWNVFRDCDLTTFEALLRQAGLHIEAQSEVVWVYGLVLADYLTPEEAKRA